MLSEIEKVIGLTWRLESGDEGWPSNLDRRIVGLTGLGDKGGEERKKEKKEKKSKDEIDKKN